MTRKATPPAQPRAALHDDTLQRLERAEAGLRASELQLRQILDNTTTALVFAKDLDGRYLFVNRAFERLAGRPQGEIVGRLTEEVFPAEVARRLRENDRAVLRAGRAVELEEEVFFGGERRLMLASKFPLFDAAGNPYAVCGTASDITERKRTEEALTRAALAVSGAGGEQVFGQLVLQLAQILGVGAAMIAVFVDATRSRMRALATCLDGRLLKPFEYELASSPCAGVIGRDYRFVASGVNPEFRAGSIFAEQGFDSYAAYSLADSAGGQLGLMVVMDRRPLASRELTEAMLKIFAVRAAAEIERSRAEAALRASEASYRAIFEANEDAVFVHDWDTGAILDVSPKASELYGYSRQELLAIRVGDISSNEPPFTEDAAARHIQQAKVHGAPLRFPWHARHKDGHLMWHEVTLKRAAIAGEPRILAFVRDVTEQRRAEQAMRASEEQYRAVFNASADALVLWNSELKRIDVNPAYERIYGFTRAEVLDTGYPAHLPQEYAEWRRDLVRRTLAGERCQAELEAIRKDGTRIQVEVRTIPIQHLGEPHVLAIVRDITERRRAEEAVRASEEQYRAIFNASADALVLWNSELQRVDCNPAFEAMFDVSREDLIAGRERRYLPPGYPDRRRELVRRTLAGEPCHLEHEVVRPNGERFMVEVRTIPVGYRGEPHVLAMLRDITERKRAESLLRASEEQYRGIFNASVDGLLLWDEALRVVDVNDAFLTLHGYSRDEILGQADPVFIPAELQERCATLLPAVIAGTPCHLELRTRRKDGAELDAEIHGVPMQYQGRPHALVVMRDITDAKRRAEQLRDSEERYRLLFETESDAIVLVDVETTRLVDANRAAESLWGYSRAELLALRVDELSAEPDRSRASIRSPEGRVHIPVRMHRRRDGTVFPVEITANRLTLDGRRTVVAVVRDITERRNAEERLRASEEQYRSIFNASADALVLRDADFRIVDVNATYERMSGYSREEVLGVDRILANPPQYEAPIRALHARALAGEPVLTETVLVRRDGERQDVELRGVPVQHRGAPHVLWMGRDITARRRSEEERRELEAQLRQAQKMEAIGHLTGGIAHDFNNILTSIMGNIALAADHDAAQGDPRLSAYLERAHASSERARDLIQQMLTFSRGRRGEPRPVALAPLVREATKLLRSMMPASIELASDIARAVPQVMLDPVHADQVLLNLCINARDAMDGRGTVGVRLRPIEVGAAVCASCRKRIAGRFVELSVADTGPGIAPEVLERIFEPFFTTKEVGKGSGMGLATVHGIVHEHGGHVLVETAIGRGTTFCVLLPELAPAGRWTGAAGPGSQAVAGRPRLAGRVLVVDDEPSVGEFMRDLLESWGLEVTLAARPDEACEAFGCRPEAFDLVITDQTMPQMTGVQLARELCALRADVPVVLYTGYADPGIEEAARAAGIVAHLRKPVEAAALRAALEAHLPAARD
jgi:PAS domain S-box-containing protein